MKETVDEALKKSPTVEKCVVLKRIGEATPMEEGRDFWWHDLMADASDDCPAEPAPPAVPAAALDQATAAPGVSQRLSDSVPDQVAGVPVEVIVAVAAALLILACSAVYYACKARRPPAAAGPAPPGLERTPKTLRLHGN